MDEKFKLLYPKKIIFEKNGLSKISDLVSGKKVLLILGSHSEKSGLKSNLIKQLNIFSLKTVVGIKPEPSLDQLDKLIKVGREFKPDTVISVGGGSVIDLGKAVAAIIPLKGFSKDYFYENKKITEKGIRFIAVPTSSGTGAEITKNSVLTDTETGIKKSIRHPEMIADTALIDPLLTLTCPSDISAACGMDAFTQAVESFISLKANIVTQALALKSISIIFENIYKVYKNPENIEARIKMSEGSLLSAMSFSQSGLGAVHGLAHPIGSILKLSHGLVCAVLLPYILRRNKESRESEYQQMAEACKLDSSEAFVSAVEKLCKQLKIPAKFADYGLEERYFDFIIDKCRSNSMKGNPRYMTDLDIIKLLKKLI